MRSPHGYVGAASKHADISRADGRSPGYVEPYHPFGQFIVVVRFRGVAEASWVLFRFLMWGQLPGLVLSVVAG